MYCVEDTYTNAETPKYYCLCPYAVSAKYSMVTEFFFRPNSENSFFSALFLGFQAMSHSVDFFN